MVKSYLKLHPNANVEEWTATSTENIFGEYRNYYK